MNPLHHQVRIGRVRIGLLVAAVAYTALCRPTMAAGSYFQVEYPASAREGELQLGVTYTI